MEETPLNEEQKAAAERMMPAMVRLANSFGDDEYLSEAMLRMVQVIPQWRGGCPLEIFVYLCVRNHLRDMARRVTYERRRGLSGTGLYPDASLGSDRKIFGGLPGEDARHRVLTAKQCKSIPPDLTPSLQQVLNHISPDLRPFARAHWVRGLTFPEMAIKFKCHANTCWQRCQVARKQAAKFLGYDWKED